MFFSEIPRPWSMTGNQYHALFLGMGTFGFNPYRLFLVSRGLGPVDHDMFLRGLLKLVPVRLHHRGKVCDLQGIVQALFFFQRRQALFQKTVGIDM